MSSRRGSFAELVALAERAGQSEALPALALAGVRNIAGLAANTDRWRPCWRPRRPWRRHPTWRW